MNNLVKLKKGDWVVMHTCGEATDPDNYGKLWRCETDEYTRGQGVYEQNLVFLEGFSGCFLTDFLQKVNLPDTTPVPTIKPGDKVWIIDSSDSSFFGKEGIVEGISKPDIYRARLKGIVGDWPLTSLEVVE